MLINAVNMSQQMNICIAECLGTAQLTDMLDMCGQICIFVLSSVNNEFRCSGFGEQMSSISLV